MYYAIEKIGYGRKERFYLKQVIDGTVIPVNGKPYKTEQDAKNAAAEAGFEVEKTGSFYEIV